MSWTRIVPLRTFKLKADHCPAVNSWPWSWRRPQINIVWNRPSSILCVPLRLWPTARLHKNARTRRGGALEQGRRHIKFCEPRKGSLAPRLESFSGGRTDDLSSCLISSLLHHGRVCWERVIKWGKACSISWGMHATFPQRNASNFPSGEFLKVEAKQRTTGGSL